MKTRVLILVLALMMVLTAVACSGGDETTGTTTTTPAPTPEAKDLSVVVEALTNYGITGYNVTIPDTKEITLKDLFEKHVAEGESFDETSEDITWTVNGEAATATTVVKNGDKVLATGKDYTPTTPKDNETLIKVVINYTKENMYSARNLCVPKGEITLKALAETYLFGGGSTTFESTLEEYEWFVNGAAATATTTVPEGATVTANYTPIPTIKVEMTAILNGETVGSGTYTVREGTTLKAFYESESDDETFEESLATTIWTVNGAPATATTVLKEGDKIVATRTEDVPPPPPTEITVKYNLIYNGEDSGTNSYTLPVGTTLKAFFESKLGDGATFESTLETTTWTVDGAAATADTVLEEGDKIVASYKEPDKEYEGDYTLPY